jgi:hypothetical protein
MATISHEPPHVAPERRRVNEFLVTEMWASIAISVMWLSVLFDALWGPDIETSSAGGTDTAIVPSAIVLALFAFLGTWVVARHGFRRDKTD